MKKFNSIVYLRGIVALLALLVLACGCTKVYKADEYNAYRDGVANPPSTTGKPAIGNIFPAQGIYNTVITISGSYFDTNPANNSVTINGVPAPIVAITSASRENQISEKIPIVSVMVTVPANATTGKIVLKTAGAELTSLFDFKVKTANMSVYADLGSNYIEHLAFDGDGNIFGDNVDKIIKVTPFGGVSTFAGGGTTNQFGFIWGIAGNSFDEVFVPDGIRHKIFRATKTGTVTTYAGSGFEGIVDGFPAAANFGSPRGMASDLGGNLFVGDVHRVRKISNTGVVTTIAGNSAEGNVDGKGALAQFGSIDGVAVDTSGNIYVSDRRYLNIRKIKPDGTVTTLAGTGAPGFTDGPANTATFNDPRGIAVDSEGNVFVADQNKATNTHAIRVVNRLGGVATLIKGAAGAGVIVGPVATASVNAPGGLAFDRDGNLFIVNTGANVISKVTITK